MTEVMKNEVRKNVQVFKINYGFDSVELMAKAYNRHKTVEEAPKTAEEMGAIVGYCDVICSWCGKYIYTKASDTGMISHTICLKCYKKQIKEMRK